MIDKRNLRAVLLERLAVLPVGHAVDIRTYKRDRSVVFTRLDASLFRVVVRGFAKDDSVVPEERLPRVIRSLLSSEFPRSNKVRLYMLGEHDPDIDPAAARKRI